ncbi:MAG: TetR family transcriptional regulator [Verrucomicrobiota bacterium]
MAKRAKPNGAVAGRNPERTRERILSAALKEFAVKGFAGARVDTIARRAAINKRMLYHYFGNKEHLFREVLRRKITERQASAEGLSGDPAESLPFWFKLSCKDANWIRLLEWEALQSGNKKVINEKRRRAVAIRVLGRIRQQQALGFLSGEFEPGHLLLAMRSLTTFPMAFPQLTRFFTNQSVSDPHFQRRHAEFLRKFAAAFQPANRRRV